MSTTLTRRPSLASFFDDDTFRFPERLFNDDFFSLPSRLLNRNVMQAATLPAVNIQDNAKSFDLELAVPGYKKEDLKVNVKDNVLTISSEKKFENEEKKNDFTRREFSYSSFNRSFVLPENVDAEKISASYDNGLLKLSIAKNGEVAVSKGREIKIG